MQTKVESRCLLFGAAPYDNVKYMTAMMAKLYSDCPSLMFLPNVSEKEDLLNRTFSGMPGIYFEEGKINFSIGLTKYEEAFKKIEKAYNNPTTENLKHYAFESEYTEKFLQMVHKFKPKNAFISLLGPFSISEMLTDNADEHLLSDKNFRKLFIYTVCVKALWIIDKIKSKSSETVPIVLFEEPALSGLGNLKRKNENITSETVINLLAKVFEKIKAAGALSGIQCFEKCDWTIPIKAGADIISFDAYNNPNNLTIIPEIVKEYLENGGLINWAIVPTKSETLIKSLSTDDIWKRLSATFGGLISSGIPSALVYKTALVSINGNTTNLPVIFAEKAYILSTQLGRKLSVMKL